MKKTFFLILMAGLITTSGYSQTKSTLRVGVKLSPEMSVHLAGWDPGPGYKYTFGQFGFTNGIQVLASHLETGLYYYQQSVVENVSLGYDIRYTASFLHIPILWRQEFGGFYFTIGPSVNINLGINRKIENQTTPGTVTFVGQHDDGDPVAFGLQTAAGYTFKITDTINLFGELRLGGIIQKYTPGTYGLGVGVNFSL